MYIILFENHVQIYLIKAWSSVRSTDKNTYVIVNSFLAPQLFLELTSHHVTFKT